MRLRRGFTLIELLVVLAIITILIALVLPAIQKVRAAADRAWCASNMRQLVVASHNYQIDFGRLPPGGFQTNVPFGPSPFGFNGNTVFAYLLPYFEQDTTYRHWNFDQPWLNVNGGANALTASRIKVLLCPTDEFPENPFECRYDGGINYGFYGATSFVGNQGTFSYYPGDLTYPPDGVFYLVGPASVPANARPSRPIKLTDIFDGTSNTIAFSERYHVDVNFDANTKRDTPLFKWGAWGWVAGFKMTGHVLGSSKVPLNWKHPVGSTTFADKDARVAGFSSGHPGGVNVAFADGSTRYLNERIPLLLLQALTTRNGAELITETDY
jgi:prepilin-type N-terminal cleavage/methylation domain-containing protein/prepilin-type processing-associated H-X9-DG protein